MNFEPWHPCSFSKSLLFKYSYKFSGDDYSTTVRIFQYMPHKTKKGFYELCKTKNLYTVMGKDSVRVLSFAIEFVSKLNRGIFPKGSVRKFKLK